MFNIKFWILIGVMVSATLSRACAETSEGDRLREITKPIDPFNRLANIPLERRPAEAIDFCMRYICGMAGDQIRMLKKIRSKDPKLQKGYLLASVSQILKAREALTTVQNTFHLSIPDKTKLKIAKIDEIIDPLRQADGAGKRQPEPTASDIMNAFNQLSGLPW